MQQQADFLSPEKLQMFVAGLSGLAPEDVRKAKLLYLRNAVSTGNPVFPSPVRLLGRDLLPGWDHVSLAHRRTLPEAAIDVPHFLTQRRDLFGPLFPYTMLPAALLALWLSILPHLLAVLGPTWEVEPGDDVRASAPAAVAGSPDSAAEQVVAVLHLRREDLPHAIRGEIYPVARIVGDRYEDAHARRHERAGARPLHPGRGPPGSGGG